MIGKYDILVESSRVSYELSIDRKYTILQGSSSTGKTRFFNGVMDELGEYTVTCDVPLVAVPTSKVFESFARSQKDEECIYVIDENVCSVFQMRDLYHSFAKLSYSMSGYFILITRSEIQALPYSPESVLFFKGVKEGKKYINRAVNRYTWEDTEVMYPDKVIVEDLKAGYAFYKNTLKCEIVSADGNSNISKVLNCVAEEHNRNIFVIGDGAGIGAYINSIFGAKEYAERMGRHVKLFFPESFEYLVLLALVGEIEQLMRTYDYADSKEYKSWEDYYTKLLRHVTERYGGYKKGVLPSYLKGRKFITKFYKNIEDLDKSCIR